MSDTLVVDGLVLYALINATCIFIMFVLMLLGWKSEGGMSKFKMTPLILSEIAFLMTDFMWTFVEGDPSTPIGVNILLNALFFSFSGTTAYIWSRYSERMMVTNFYNTRAKKIIFAIPIVALVLLSFAAFISDKFIFYIDANNTYHRGPLYFLQPLITFAYIVFASGRSFAQARREKVVSNKERDMALALFALAPITCMIVQFFMPGVPTVGVGCTVGIIYVYISILTKRSENQKSVISSITYNYEDILMVDLSDGKVTDYRRGFLTRSLDDVFGGSTNSFTERVMRIAETYVVEEDREAFYNALSIHHLKRELEENCQTYIDSRIKTERGVEFYRTKVVANYDFYETQLCVLAFQNVDEKTRYEMQRNLLLEEARSRAESANNAKSTFLFNMSHDIRTPMNAILGFTNLARKKIKTDPEATDDYLSKVEVSSQHLLKLINDVLDMARIESGKVTIEETDATIHGCGDAILTMTSSLAESRNIELTVDYKDIEHEYIFADILHLDQITLNIVGNALKYTNPGGKVAVTISEKPSRDVGYANYVVVCEDNGIGMSEDFLKHIFESFERERSATISGVEGAGLGMSITKRLIDMMEGSIEIESELGIGTKVIMRFKLRIRAMDESVDGPLEDTSYEPAFDLRDKRILVVEDNELNREIATELLEEQGVIVDIACDGLEAVDKIKLSDPGDFDLILMDIQMPKLDGYEATKLIRNLEHKGLRDIPIVAMTANAFDEDKKKALDSGMDGFIAKPVDPAKLVATVSEFTKKS
ncbi:MAG: response regulator [Clostridia bacterium]|nr:response regulator [Clostridia bacterium]